MVYNKYVLITCKRMFQKQQINCYNTAYAVVKMLLYGDLMINKYSYSYSYTVYVLYNICLSYRSGEPEPLLINICEVNCFYFLLFLSYCTLECF
jgi:hypothetical protein